MNKLERSETYRMAVNLILQQYYSEEDECEEVVISDQLEKKMDQLLRVHKKMYYKMINTVGKRVAVIIISISSLFVVTNAKAIYEVVIDFVIKDRVKDSSVTFDIPSETNYPDTIKELHIPTYITKGFEEKERLFVEELMLKITYKNELDQEYIFSQMLLDTSQVVNTEGVNTDIIVIDEMSILYLENLGETIATWNDCEYGYSITGEISREEVIKIIKSIKDTDSN